MILKSNLDFCLSLSMIHDLSKEALFNSKETEYCGEVESGVV